MTFKLSPSITTMEMSYRPVMYTLKEVLALRDAGLIDENTQLYFDRSTKTDNEDLWYKVMNKVRGDDEG